MSSPSRKLTLAQNEARKMLKKEFKARGGFVFSVPEYGVTICIRRTGTNMGEFALAIAGPGEPKFYRKVGEYHALNRALNRVDMNKMQPVYLPEPYMTEDDLRRISEQIAEALGEYREHFRKE